MKKTANNLRYGLWLDSRNAKIIKIFPEGKIEFYELYAENSKRERFSGETTNKIGMLDADKR
jgi:hypothetical protein